MNTPDAYLRDISDAELAQIDEQHILHGWSIQADYKSDIVVGGDGCYYTTASGKPYLDFASQLGYANIGHGDTRVVEAITDEAWSVATIYGSAKRPTARLAVKLLSLLPKGYERIFFGLNGSDGVEAAIKTARLVTGRQEIIAFDYGYHGSSAGAASVGGLARNKVGDGVPGTVRVYPPYHYRSPVAGADQDETDRNTVEVLRRTIQLTGPENVAAVIGEPMLGSGVGVIPGPTYWQQIRQVCDDYGILLIGDEVITGFGRTGHWFALEHYDYQPDIVVFGKGLTSGYLPLSATVINKRVSDLLADRFWPHGLTNAHHAACCAAALGTIRVIEDDDLIANAARSGEHLGTKLGQLHAQHRCIGDVRHIGLFAIVELVSDVTTKAVFPTGTRIADGEYGAGDIAVQVRAAMLERGVRVTAYRSTGIVALVPPLPITIAQIDTVIEAFDDVLTLVDEIVAT